MSDSRDEQIMDLQMRVSFQEETLLVISEQMAALSMDLELARKQIQLLSDKIKNRSFDDEQLPPTNERPPHY